MTGNSLDAGIVALIVSKRNRPLFMGRFFHGVPGMFIRYRVKVPKALYSREP